MLPSFLVPEIVQTSAMDCGPAALKSILEGLGVNLSYGRLREACQTDLDGTSIDTLEDIAVQLGLDAEQIMLPADHLFLSQQRALPAIAVVCLPNGLTHFVVLWRVHGNFVQIMDPGLGRRWLTIKNLLNDLYIHTQYVPAQSWREWAGSDDFLNPLKQRFAKIDIHSKELIAQALEDHTWQALATLDAAARMTTALVNARGIEPGSEAARVLAGFSKHRQTIPEHYWSVKSSGQDQVALRGAVLIRMNPSEAVPKPETNKLSPELKAALTEAPLHPEKEILRILKSDGLLSPLLLLSALCLAGIGVLIEIILFKGLLDLGQVLNIVTDRIKAVEIIYFFFIAMLVLEVPIAAMAARMGRHLEIKFRKAFLEKIPRLGDYYFNSRLTSDMTQRAYELRQIRILPGLAILFLRIIFQIILTTAGIIWLIPSSALIAVWATCVAMGIALISQPILREQDMRLRNHIGGLSRFYLDALLGLIPIRTHGAEKSVRSEHESLLVDWMRAGLGMFRVALGISTLEIILNFGFAIWIIFNYIDQGGGTGVLLLLYWTLRLPELSQILTETAQQYPIQRNRILRLLEPLGAPDEEAMWTPEHKNNSEQNQKKNNADGMRIQIQDVNVQAGGHTILQQINLNLKPGEQIGIIGPSGAGKSSLMGLLLGWLRPAGGQIYIDGKLLSGEGLEQIRTDTAWVDPSVRIWNRSLTDNLLYGASSDAWSGLETTMQQADLIEILDRLPFGPSTPLGEGGGLISGGEGQRVRLGRAILRPNVRLVILDEPFRGLDRSKRHQLLQKSRQGWKNQTMLFISHDLRDALSMDRVIVMENGRIIEDDIPEKLMARPDSRCRQLLDSEIAVRKNLWEDKIWRRLWLEDGILKEKGQDHSLVVNNFS